MTKHLHVLQWRNFVHNAPVCNYVVRSGRGGDDDSIPQLPQGMMAVMCLRQKHFREITEAHLASPIRGERGYRPTHWPQLVTQICGLLGQECVWPNFALTVSNFVISHSGNLTANAKSAQALGFALNTPIQAMTSADWGVIICQRIMAVTISQPKPWSVKTL